MVCDVHGVGIEATEAIQNHILRSMQAALDQYQNRVGHVSVKIHDTNGPRGGRDKQCVVNVELLRGRKVLVRELGEDMYATISAAADRVKVAVGRQLERAKERRSVHGG